MKSMGVAILLLSATAVAAQSTGFLGIRAKKGDTPADCAIVEQVAPGSPADVAGLSPGDVISKIDGVEIACGSLRKGNPILSGVQPGDRVAFEILRRGTMLKIPVVAGELPSASGLASEERSRLEKGRAVLDRLTRTQEVFTITFDEDGFQVSGNLSRDEAVHLQYYLDTKFGKAFFSQSSKKGSQDMYLRFDREKGAYRFELAAPSVPAGPKAGSGAKT